MTHPVKPGQYQNHNEGSGLVKKMIGLVMMLGFLDYMHLVDSRRVFLGVSRFQFGSTEDMGLN